MFHEGVTFGFQTHDVFFPGALSIRVYPLSSTISGSVSFLEELPGRAAPRPPVDRAASSGIAAVQPQSIQRFDGVRHGRGTLSNALALRISELSPASSSRAARWSSAIRPRRPTGHPGSKPHIPLGWMPSFPARPYTLPLIRTTRFRYFPSCGSRRRASATFCRRSDGQQYVLPDTSWRAARSSARPVRERLIRREVLGPRELMVEPIVGCGSLSADGHRDVRPARRVQQLAGNLGPGGSVSVGNGDRDCLHFWAQSHERKRPRVIDIGTRVGVKNDLRPGLRG